MTGLQKRHRLEEVQLRQDPVENQAEFYDRMIIHVYDISNRGASSGVCQTIPFQIDDIIMKWKKYESFFLEEYLPFSPRQGRNAIRPWLLESVCINNPGGDIERDKEALFRGRADYILRI
jgi:hypothetical protein